MRYFVLFALLGSMALFSSAQTYKGGPYYFRSYELLPGLPRPKNPITGADEAAIRDGTSRTYAYIEASYSPTGKLRQMRKLYKGKVLWKYEFIYVEDEVQKVLEYDSKGRASTYYSRNR